MVATVRQVGEKGRFSSSSTTSSAAFGYPDGLMGAWATEKHIKFTIYDK